MFIRWLFGRQSSKQCTWPEFIAMKREQLNRMERELSDMEHARRFHGVQPFYDDYIHVFENMLEDYYKAEDIDLP